MNAHIHTPEDGRGHRAILVNGKRVDAVFYADTQRGIVRAYRHPYRFNRWRNRLLSYTLRGEVSVVAL